MRPRRKPGLELSEQALPREKITAPIEIQERPGQGWLGTGLGAGEPALAQPPVRHLAVVAGTWRPWIPAPCRKGW